MQSGTNVYRIESVLGAGGFGVTYCAWDEKLERRVAIKEYFPRDFSGRTAALTVVPTQGEGRDMFAWGKARFLDEARTLAKFDHPGIVGVLDFFEGNNTAYLVMPLVDGTPLSEVLKRQPYSETEARDLLDALVSALAVVHRAGFLHRDVKPGNIMIQSTDRRPVLIDFGTARQSLGSATRSVTTLASASFSPREQYLENAPQTVASEVYSICATVYRAMFQSGPPVAIGRDETDSLPELDRAEAAGEISPGLATTLRKGLAYHARDRFQSLDALRVAAHDTSGATAHATAHTGAPKRAQPEVPPAPVAARPGWWRQGIALALVVAFALMAAGLALRAPQAGGSAPGAGAQAAPWPASALAPVAMSLPGAGTPVPDSSPEPDLCQGSEAACLDAARTRLLLPGQAHRVAAMLGEACARKWGGACAELAQLLLTGRETLAADPKQALAFATAGCGLGAAEGCTLAAGLLVHAAPANDMHADRNEAARLIAHACALHDAVACTRAGAPPYRASEAALQVETLRRDIETGTGVGTGVSTAVLAQVVACDRDEDGRACVEAGLGFATGAAGGTVDATRATMLYERSCELGNGFGCGYLGKDFATGQGGRSRDLSRAAALFDLGCVARNMEACLDLGRLNLLAQDYAGANAALGQKALGKACDEGDMAAACADLALAYETGRVPGGRNDRKAAMLFLKACGGNAATACARLGVYYEDGRGGLPRDQAAAQRLKDKACKLGAQIACRKSRKI
ncbi:serine/threonine-protein kinase [Rhodobacter maris]|uniref:serine/threonine-protein kinase n=1 Tax=Rhodobacter maris TaxID=446682 RepID=UPI0015967A8B|nr:protein kinase [Rhodobacter maris]